MGLAHSTFNRRSPLSRVGGNRWGGASTLSNFDLVKKHSQANREEINVCTVRVVVRGGGVGCLVKLLIIESLPCVLTMELL